MRIEGRGIRVRYAGAERLPLDGVDLDVPDGELYAVVGPNGSGKSTLLKALLGVVPLESGTVTLDGRTVGDWSRSELARHVGVVAQSESVSFPLTVREMVGMGRYPHLGALQAEGPRDRDAVDQALEQADVPDLDARDVTTLSGGELQRVRIARALAQEPRALLLDEPTSSLDVRHEMAILELLRAWADEGMTVLVVTHGLNLAARFADRVLLLSRGSVAAQGPPAKVFTAEVLEAVYRWPVAVHSDDREGVPTIRALRAGEVGRPR